MDLGELRDLSIDMRNIEGQKLAERYNANIVMPFRGLFERILGEPDVEDEPASELAIVTDKDSVSFKGRADEFRRVSYVSTIALHRAGITKKPAWYEADGFSIIAQTENVAEERGKGWSRSERLFASRDAGNPQGPRIITHGDGNWTPTDMLELSNWLNSHEGTASDLISDLYVAISDEELNPEIAVRIMPQASEA